MTQSCEHQTAGIAPNVQPVNAGPVGQPPQGFAPGAAAPHSCSCGESAAQTAPMGPYGQVHTWGAPPRPDLPHGGPVGQPPYGPAPWGAAPTHSCDHSAHGMGEAPPHGEDPRARYGYAPAWGGPPPAGYPSAPNYGAGAYAPTHHENHHALLAGLVVGAAAAYLLSNETVQRSMIRSAVSLWSTLQGGVEELKERFRDAEAERQAAAPARPSTDETA